MAEAGGHTPAEWLWPVHCSSSVIPFKGHPSFPIFGEDRELLKETTHLPPTLRHRPDMMRGQLSLTRVTQRPLSRIRPAYVCVQCRAIQISAAPTTESPRSGNDAFGTTRDTAGMQLEVCLGNRKLTDDCYVDARFEVLGTPYSLLSVTLSASQKLYTRRGTLVTVAGKVQNVSKPATILLDLTDSLSAIGTINA